MAAHSQALARAHRQDAAVAPFWGRRLAVVDLKLCQILRVTYLRRKSHTIQVTVLTSST